MSQLFLKIKIKSLVDEVYTIRREESLLAKDDPRRQAMISHRRHDIRLEMRATLLAYGFLRGRKYRQIESRTHTEPNWKRVARLVEKYGELTPSEAAKVLETWRAEDIRIEDAA